MDYIVEIITNIVLPAWIAYFLGFGINGILFVSLGALFIDIDHFIYFLSRRNINGLYDLIEAIKSEYSGHKPHIYPLHLIEVQILLLILILFANHPVLNYMFVGGLLNVMMDVLLYSYIYRSKEPWIEYFSLTYYYLRKMRKKLQANQNSAYRHENTPEY